MVHYGNIPIPHALSLVPNKTSTLLGFSINTHSIRLRLFKEAYEQYGRIRCVCCGTMATHFALESHIGEKPHLNLYGDTHVFTKDHIHPKSLGGMDTLSNLQVMCQPCNEAKGNLLNKDTQ